MTHDGPAAPTASWEDHVRSVVHPFVAADVAASWGEWAANADLADEPDVALRFLAVHARAAGGTGGAGGASHREAAAYDQARLLLFAGRPGQAVDVLVQAGLDEVLSAPATTPGTALPAACRAACGDHEAYRWLLAGLRDAQWGASWTAAYVVAAAAEGLGDHETVDEMWHRIVDQHGIRTRKSLQRAAVAVVHRRDREVAHASASAALEAALLLDAVPLGVTADPAGVLAAASALRERGDHEGAVLLLQAVVRCTQSHPQVAAELDRLAPVARRHRQEVTHWALLAAGAVLGYAVGHLTGFLALGSLCTVAGLLAGRFRAAHRRLPGLGRTASRAFVRLAQLEHEVHDGTVRIRAVQDQRGYYGAVALLTAAVPAPLVATAVVNAVEARAGAGSGLVEALWLLFEVGGLVGGYLGARWVHHRARRHSRIREHVLAHRARARAQQRCVCFETPVISGGFVAEVRRAHLRPIVATADVSRRFLDALGVPAELVWCPTTGYLWAQVPTPSAQPLLLRGAVAAGTSGSDRKTPVPTGFYL